MTRWRSLCSPATSTNGWVSTRSLPSTTAATQPTEDSHLVTFNGILVPVNLLDRVGALREDFHVGFEDRDFARRVARLGGRLVVSSRVLGIHPTRGNGRFPEPIAPERLYYSVRNQLISRREIGERPELRRVARGLGAATRALVTADAASAAARVRGLRDGVTTPVARAKADLATRVVVTSGPRAPTRSPARSWTCRACGEETRGIVLPVVSWRSLPDRIPFPYGECGVCGSLTLLDPVDPSGYYDADYDRLAPRSPVVPRRWSRSVVGAVCRWAGSVDVLSRVAMLDRAAPSWYGWFRGLHVTARSPVLDVGCGNGALLFHLRSFGFKQLAGIDPFLVDEHVGSGVSLRRHHLDQVAGRFQVILFNHSLEHVDDPGELLDQARDPSAAGWRHRRPGADRGRSRLAPVPGQPRLPRRTPSPLHPDSRGITRLAEPPSVGDRSLQRRDHCALLPTERADPFRRALRPIRVPRRPPPPMGMPDGPARTWRGSGPGYVRACPGLNRRDPTGCGPMPRDPSSPATATEPRAGRRC